MMFNQLLGQKGGAGCVTNSRADVTGRDSGCGVRFFLDSIELQQWIRLNGEYQKRKTRWIPVRKYLLSITGIPYFEE